MKLQRLLEDEKRQKKRLEEEVIILQSQLSQLAFEADPVCHLHKVNKLVLFIQNSLVPHTI